MRKSNSKFDLSKGFRRIYFVIATIWGLFLVGHYLGESSKCIPYKDYTLAPRCDSWWASSTLGPILTATILWAATAIPAYFFFK